MLLQILGKLCKTCCGKLALRFWMGCKAQTAAIAVLWRGRCQRRRRFCRASLAKSLFFCLCALSLAACGQKGPLFFPGHGAARMQVLEMVQNADFMHKE